MIKPSFIPLPPLEKNGYYECLNLGCGNQKIPSTQDMKWTNIDNSPSTNPDILWDLEKGLPAAQDIHPILNVLSGTEKHEHKIPLFKNIDLIYANHFLEHLSNPLTLLAECWQALKPKGIIHIKVPNGTVISHPCHKSFFSPMWFALLNPTHPEHYEIKQAVMKPCDYKIIKWTLLAKKEEYGNITLRFDELEVVLEKA